MTEIYRRVQPNPYFCQNCYVRTSGMYFHPTLGWVCPICLRPMASTKSKKKRRRKKRRRLARLSPTLLRVGERDGWICQLCLEPIDPRDSGIHRASVDHIVRKRHGGTRDMSNLRIAHQSCNSFREGSNVVPFAPPKVR